MNIGSVIYVKLTALASYVRLAAATRAGAIQAAVGATYIAASTSYVRLTASVVSSAAGISASVYAQAIVVSAALGKFLNALTFFEDAQANDTIAASTTKPLSDSASVAEFKAVGTSKTVSDSVHATDDVNGVAADDDQNLQVVKVISDLAHPADVVTKQVTFARGFSEQTANTDRMVAGFGKAKTDSVSAADVLSMLLNRGVSLSDQAATSELRTKAILKTITDTAASGDAAARSVSKVVADAAAAAAVSRLSVGKALTDGASSSDSGSIIVQGYVSEDYFLELYVGSQTTF